MTFVTDILAMAGAPGGGGAEGGNPFSMMVPMVLIFGIFYFMIIRPQQRKEKERRAMIDEIKTGTRILFSGGIVGTVANVKENTLIVKIADKVKVEIVRGAVTRVLSKDDKIGEEEQQ
jgi:preprotein translocase subunit YajC